MGQSPKQDYLPAELITYTKDTIDVIYFKDKVWVNDSTLVLYKKQSKDKVEIRPFEYDRIYLNNSLVISHEFEGQAIFLKQLIVNGEYKLYKSKGKVLKYAYYIQGKNGNIDKIPERNFKDFLIQKFYNHDVQSNRLIDGLIFPEFSVYGDKNFEHIIYTYNEAEIREFNTASKRKIKYRPYFGFEVGIINNGISLGTYFQLPINPYIRFDIGTIYSNYRARSLVAFGAFNTFEADAKINEIAIPIGIRLIPIKNSHQFSIQGGFIPNYARLDFSELSATIPSQSIANEVNINLYIGLGYNWIYGSRHSVGFDIKHIFDHIENLTQLTIRKSF